MPYKEEGLFPMLGVRSMTSVTKQAKRVQSPGPKMHDIGGKVPEDFSSLEFPWIIVPYRDEDGDPCAHTKGFLDLGGVELCAEKFMEAGLGSFLNEIAYLITSGIIQISHGDELRRYDQQFRAIEKTREFDDGTSGTFLEIKFIGFCLGGEWISTEEVE